MARVLSILLLLSFLLGCSQTPEIPSLPGQKTTSIEQIVLSDRITVKDVKSIFRALNQDGKLSSLKPWFETASDSELSALGNFATVHLYEENFQKSGLVSLLEARNQRRGFGLWKSSLEKWQNSPDFADEWAGIQDIYQHRRFSNFIEGDISLLDGEYHRLLNRLKAESTAKFKSTVVFPSPVPVSDEAIARDLLRFVKDDALRLPLLELIPTLSQNAFAESVLLTLEKLFHTYKNSRPFEGFILGHSLRLDDKKFESLLTLLDTLNAPPEGLFQVASDNLNANPGIGHELAKRLDPQIGKAAADFIVERLSSTEANFLQTRAFWLNLPRKETTLPPTPEFIKLFTYVQWGIEFLKNETQGPTFLKFPVRLASLLVTEWFEHFAKSNSAFLQSLSEESFSKQFWNSKTSVAPLKLSLIQEPDPEKKNELSDRLAKDLGAIPEMESFREDLKKALKDPEFGAKTYTFPAQTNLPLSETLAKVATTVQKRIAIADPAPLFMGLLNYLAGKEKNSPLHVLEKTENLLDTLLNTLQSMRYPQWIAFRSLVFEKMQLGKLDATDRTLVALLYEGHPKILARLNRILDNLQSLYDYDTGLQNLPSSFEGCHALLRETRPDQIHGNSALLSFLARSAVFHHENGVYSFPAIVQTLKNGISLSEHLFRIALATPGDRDKLLSVAEKLEVSETLRALADISQENPRHILSLLKALSEKGLELLPGEAALTEGERNWLMRFFSKDGEHRTVEDFLRTHSSKKNLLQFVRELITLSANGGLSDALTHLSHIKNERIQRLALVLGELQKSGELSQLFTSLESLLTR